MFQTDKPDFFKVVFGDRGNNCLRCTEATLLVKIKNTKKHFQVTLWFTASFLHWQTIILCHQMRQTLKVLPRDTANKIKSRRVSEVLYTDKWHSVWSAGKGCLFITPMGSLVVCTANTEKVCFIHASEHFLKLFDTGRINLNRTGRTKARGIMWARYLHAADCDCGAGTFCKGRGAFSWTGGCSDVVNCHIHLKWGAK